MDVETLLTNMVFIIIPILAIGIYVAVTWSTTESYIPCRTNITGNSQQVFNSLSKCIDKCWSKHRFGQDVYNEDCYTTYIKITTPATNSVIRSSLSKSTPTSFFFNSLEAGEHSIKVRYNSSVPEISLFLIY